MSRPTKYQETLVDEDTIDQRGIGKAYGVVFEVCMKKGSSNT